MNELTKETKEAKEFNKLQAQVTDIVQRAAELKITDSTTLAIATQVLSEVKQAYDNVEAKRVELKEPSLQEGRAVDALAKAYLTPLKAALDKGKSIIMAYNYEQAQKAIKEQQRIEGIRDKISAYSKSTMIAIDFAKDEKELRDINDRYIVKFPGTEKWFDLEPEAQAMRLLLRDYIKAVKIQMLTPEEADEQVLDVIKEYAAEQIAEVGKQEIEQAAFTSSTPFRASWQFSLVDIKAVPKEWLIVDDKKVKEYIKENKDTLVSGDLKNGFHFFQEQTVVIK